MEIQEAVSMFCSHFCPILKSEECFIVKVSSVKIVTSPLYQKSQTVSNCPLKRFKS